MLDLLASLAALILASHAALAAVASPYNDLFQALAVVLSAFF